MMRLLNGAATMLVYFLASTLIAELLIAGYLWSALKLDPKKLAQVGAALRGVETRPAEKAAAPLKSDAPPEQVSYQEILDRRAVKVRDLELREQSLRTTLEELKTQQRQLAEDEKRQKQLVGQFASQVKSFKEGAQAEGRDVVARTLETLKPKQAKEQITQMLENNEIDQVVLLLSELTETKRAKILTEFKTPDENKRLAEVLRLIRQGQPQSSVADKAQSALPQAKPSGS